MVRNNTVSEEDQFEMEQKELLKPFKRSRKIGIGLLKFFITIKDLILKIYYWMRMHDKPMLLIFFLVFVTMLSVIIWQHIYFTNKYITKKLNDVYTYEGKIERLKELKSSHQKYLNLSSEERLFKWIRTYNNWRYETNGDPKYRKSDCVGAVYTYFQLLGSNIILENIPGITKRIENLSERNLLTIRKSGNDVVSGDLILLKISSENQHMGVIIDVCPTGLIRYCDMNVGTGTWGLESIKFGDSRIKYIAEVSFALWVGDFIQEFNK